MGRRNDPNFRLIITDSRRPPKSRAVLEILGSYDARKNKAAQLNAERIKYWLLKGARVSDTAHNLLVSAKIIEGPKKAV